MDLGTRDARDTARALSRRPSARRDLVVNIVIQVIGQVYAGTILLYGAVLAARPGPMPTSSPRPALLDQLHSPAAFIAAWILSATATALLWFRYRRPDVVAPIVILLDAIPGGFVTYFVILFSYAACSKRWKTVLLLLLATSTSILLFAFDADFQDITPLIGLLIVGFIFVVQALVALAGVYVGTRRTLLANLRERAERAELERERHEQRIQADERTRIAREMHDIVAHQISLVALHAGALEVRPDQPPSDVEKAAALIRTTATTALEELRGVLGVLRDGSGNSLLVPQPVWKDLQGLVDESRSAGIKVRVCDETIGHVPDGVARTAYRVVQEGLTNIHKHARHTEAEIFCGGSRGGGLVIEIRNRLPVGSKSELPGARMGLTGIETRVDHAGGSMSAGPTESGDFLVRAVIPWTA